MVASGMQEQWLSPGNKVGMAHSPSLYRVPARPSRAIARRRRLSVDIVHTRRIGDRDSISSEGLQQAGHRLPETDSRRRRRPDAGRGMMNPGLRYSSDL